MPSFFAEAVLPPPDLEAAPAHPRLSEDLIQSRTHPARPLALAGAPLRVTTLLTAGLTGCSALSPFNTCDDTATRVKEPRSQPILRSAPERATVPTDLASVHAGWLDDSGEAWLSAERIYALPGPRQKVVDLYRTTAKVDGWRLRSDPVDQSTRETVAGLCFPKGGNGHALLLTVRFSTPRRLRSSTATRAAPISTGLRIRDRGRLRDERGEDRLLRLTRWGLSHFLAFAAGQAAQ